MAQIDYKKIERDYMTSHDNLNELSKRYSCSRAQLYRYAKAHDWENKRERKQQKRLESAIEREFVSQEEAWESIKNQMREVVANEWKKLAAEKHPSGSQVSALAKATKDVRDMGAFGVSLAETKLSKEIESLEKQLASTEETKDITISIEGGEGYDG